MKKCYALGQLYLNKVGSKHPICEQHINNDGGNFELVLTFISVGILILATHLALKATGTGS